MRLHVRCFFFLFSFWKTIVSPPLVLGPQLPASIIRNSFLFYFNISGKEGKQATIELFALTHSSFIKPQVSHSMIFLNL